MINSAYLPCCLHPHPIIVCLQGKSLPVSTHLKVSVQSCNAIIQCNPHATPIITARNSESMRCVCADREEAARQPAAQHSLRAGLGEQQRQGATEEGESSPPQIRRPHQAGRLTSLLLKELGRTAFTRGDWLQNLLVILLVSVKVPQQTVLMYLKSKEPKATMRRASQGTSSTAGEMLPPVHYTRCLLPYCFTLCME